MTTSRSFLRNAVAALAALAALAHGPVAAQGIEQVDPNTAIDGDLQENPGEPDYYTQQNQPPQPQNQPAPAETGQPTTAPSWSDPGTGENWAAGTASADATVEREAEAASEDPSTTYGEDDLIGAATGVFGKGAEGLARMIQDLLAKQGEPNAYIVGREAGGAFIFGARYGSGKLFHKVEGEMPVYWTGPSIGFDVGANAANTFVLVYNLYDTDDLYERFPAGEGQVYVIGGLTASYLRKGNIVLIPIRMGAGLRLGVNAGYMKFSRKQRWLPF